MAVAYVREHSKACHRQKNIPDRVCRGTLLRMSQTFTAPSNAPDTSWLPLLGAHATHDVTSWCEVSVSFTTGPSAEARGEGMSVCEGEI